MAVATEDRFDVIVRARGTDVAWFFYIALLALHVKWSAGQMTLLWLTGGRRINECNACGAGIFCLVTRDVKDKKAGMKRPQSAWQISN